MPLSKSVLPPKPEAEWSFEAIGTAWWIGIFEPVDNLVVLQRTVASRIEEFDKTYSRFRADSLVTKLAEQAGNYDFPPDSERLFAWYRDLYDATDGLVTPLIGQSLSDAGYDAEYSLKPGDVTPPPTWGDVMEVSGTRVTVKRPALLDFGAAGKGYLIDIISELLQGAGVSAYCVDGSGDMYCSGLPAPLRVGLEDPHDTAQVIGVAELQQGALCASAGSRRRWAQYTHILNPQTLESPTEITAVWTTAETAMISDGLTTALCFKEPTALQSLATFEYAVVRNGEVTYSKGFPGQFF